MKELMKKLRRWFVLQWFRFKLAQQFLSLISFCMLVIAISDKVKFRTHIERTSTLLVIIPAASFLLVWLIGVFLDKRVKYYDEESLIACERQPVTVDIHKILERIEKKVDALSAGK